MKRIKSKLSKIVPIYRITISLPILFSRFFLTVSVCTCITINGCSKLIDVKPPVTSVSAENVFSMDATAIAVITDVYSQMSLVPLTDGGLTSMSLYPGLLADELIPFSQNADPYSVYYNNNINSLSPGGSHFWNPIYQVIFVANSAIEGITASGTLNSSVKTQLLGESKFIRAFCYFYLVNMYGGVPLATTTNYKVNQLLPRASKEQVYEQIVSDLKDAENLMVEKYVDADVKTQSENTERIRPNKWAAVALLARVHLYLKDYINAELEASKVIDESELYILGSLTSTFLKNSKEAIWQLQPVHSQIENTRDGALFVLPETGPDFSRPVVLSENLLHSFEFGDKRRDMWVDSVITNGIVYYFPYKYKMAGNSPILGEYSTVLRLGEQYLIRAEARINQNNIKGGVDDLNIIRTRARSDHAGSLPNLPYSISKLDALKAVAHERQVELFTEWGHRWLDLKRLEDVNSVLSSIKGGNWQSTDQLLPIPQYELNKNKSLQGHQNPGYN